MRQYRTLTDGRNIWERRHPGGVAIGLASVAAGKMQAPLYKFVQQICTYIKIARRGLFCKWT